MIEKSYSRFILYCDFCGEEMEGQIDSFDEAVDKRKAQGWKRRKVDKEWQDICPKCQGVPE